MSGSDNTDSPESTRRRSAYLIAALGTTTLLFGGAFVASSGLLLPQNRRSLRSEFDALLSDIDLETNTEYPLAKSGSGPAIQIGANTGLVVTNAELVVLTFGDAINNGTWLKLFFDKDPEKLTPAETKEQFALGRFRIPRGHLWGIYSVSSDNPNQKLWWDDWGYFLTRNYAQREAPGTLILEYGHLERGQPDQEGQSYNASQIIVTTPGAGDEEEEIVPFYFSDLGIQSNFTVFPFDKVRWWFGEFNTAGFDEEFMNSLLPIVSIAVRGKRGGPEPHVFLQRSIQDARLIANDTRAIESWKNQSSTRSPTAPVTKRVTRKPHHESGSKPDKSTPRGGGGR
jgi:hypothetical protein